jgi:hypothetical protein
MFGKSKEEKAAAEAERAQERWQLQQDIANDKAEEISEIMKLDEKEIQAEILFQLRGMEQLNKNVVVEMQNLNEGMRKNTKINKQTRDLTALD